MQDRSYLPNRQALTAWTLAFCLALLIWIGHAAPAKAFGLGETATMATAFFTHLAVHESGHYVMGHMGGAHDVQIDFLTQQGGNFYLGLSLAKGLQQESRLPYKVAGEAAASYSFEVALRSYRRKPSLFNRSLLFFSGTDFLVYSIYAFYISEDRNPSYDPVGISAETGLSDETIVGLAALQTALNAWRIYSGLDRWVPYFSVSKDWAEFGIRINP